MQIDKCRVSATHKRSRLAQAVTARAKQTWQRVDEYRENLIGNSLQQVQADIDATRMRAAMLDIADMTRHIGFTDAQMREALRWYGTDANRAPLAALKRLRRYGKLCPWWTAAHQRALPVLPPKRTGRTTTTAGVAK